MGLLERVERARRGDEHRFTLADYQQMFNYDGIGYQIGLTTTYPGQKLEQVQNSLPAYSSTLKQSPPAFAAQMVRAQVLSQARFIFRNKGRSGTPRRLYGTTALAPLEAPWRGATTGELISRCEWHAGLAGNAFVHRRKQNAGRTTLRVLRPDWVWIAYGSDLEPDDPMHALDGDVLGYVYRNGGEGQKPQVLAPEDVAHWSPIPDPESPGLGMSWLTPALREMQGDRAASEHKLKFFQNGATPNLVVKGLPAKTKESFDELVDMLEANHTGVRNAYRTLYLAAGADATVVGANLKDVDFKSVIGSGETRISVLSRVPAALLGISEGLAGSSLNAGNFSAARRSFADTWVYPALQDLAASLSTIVDVPADSELWTETGDMPLLREDGKDAADIAQVQATTIRSLVDAGYTPASVVKALRANDWGLLEHSGLYSVQLQKPGATTPAPTATE